MDALDLLKERAEEDDPNSLFALVNDLSKVRISVCLSVCVCECLKFVQVLCKKIADDNLWSMVSHLLEGLADYQSQSSSGACVVLNGVVKTRMTALLPKV